MSVVLADGNVLIALTVEEHVHHDAAVGWFDAGGADLATCPITEGTLLRFLMREGWTAPDAMGVLESLRATSWHRFWPADVAFDSSQLAGVIGHRQITDAYLVALARHHSGRLATFDRGLAALHGDAVELLG
jgi:toxin-antitoxin system PIN domain toxin